MTITIGNLKITTTRYSAGSIIAADYGLEHPEVIHVGGGDRRYERFDAFVISDARETSRCVVIEAHRHANSSAFAVHVSADRVLVAVDRELIAICPNTFQELWRYTSYTIDTILEEEDGYLLIGEIHAERIVAGEGQPLQQWSFSRDVITNYQRRSGDVLWLDFMDEESVELDVKSGKIIAADGASGG